MNVRLVPDGKDVIQDDMMRFTNRIINFRSSDQRQVDRAIRRGAAKSFSNQGQVVNWQQLADSTVSDRINQGYPGRRPILIRTGDYMRSFVNPGHPDNIFEYRQARVRWTITSGSEEERVEFLEYGTRFMPARPVMDFSRRTEDDIGRVVEGIFDRVFEQITRR